jgi:nucleoside-diphosphate-sugar epimerase
MQTILGAGGAIGIPLAKELVRYSDKIRLVGRNPKKINPADELFNADITDYNQIMEAVKGSEIVYLVAGLKYDLTVWQIQWPSIMKNVIDACKKHNSKLLFFDNVYMYGRVNGWMTEETPFNPCSRKGEVRARIAQMLTDEYKKKNLEAVIVRSADFYGAGLSTSVFNILVIDKLKKGQSANWLLNDKVKHSFTYNIDAARASALIGNTTSAFNQIWHLPSDKNALTGAEYIKLTAKILGSKPKYSVLKKWQLRLVGMFVSNIKESMEMLYQSEYEYLFDSTKFENYFNIKPTPYKEGIAASV